MKVRKENNQIFFYEEIGDFTLGYIPSLAHNKILVFHKQDLLGSEFVSQDDLELYFEEIRKRLLKFSDDDVKKA